MKSVVKKLKGHLKQKMIKGKVEGVKKSLMFLQKKSNEIQFTQKDPKFSITRKHDLSNSQTLLVFKTNNDSGRRTLVSLSSIIDFL